MINSPWDTKSDTYFFVNNTLVMHNRAEYNYSPLDEDEELVEDGEENFNEVVWQRDTYVIIIYYKLIYYYNLERIHRMRIKRL